MKLFDEDQNFIEFIAAMVSFTLMFPVLVLIQIVKNCYGLIVDEIKK